MSLSIEQINKLESENKQLKSIIHEIEHWLTAYANSDEECLRCCGHQLLTIHIPEILAKAEIIKEK